MADDVRDTDYASCLGYEDHTVVEEPQALHRIIYRGHCTLSNSIDCHARGINIHTGYINNSRCITPLHIPHVVVGHTHERVGDMQHRHH